MSELRYRVDAYQAGSAPTEWLVCRKNEAAPLAVCQHRDDAERLAALLTADDERIEREARLSQLASSTATCPLCGGNGCHPRQKGIADCPKCGGTGRVNRAAVDQG